MYTLNDLTQYLRAKGADVSLNDVWDYAKAQGLVVLGARPTVTHKGAEAIAAHYAVTL